MEIFIPGNVPSLKNSKVLTGRGGLANSKSVNTYIKESAKYWHENLDKFNKMLELAGSPPYFIHITFARKSRHKFDYVGPCETIQDFMRDFLWLLDDNVDEMVPVFGKYIYNKDNPGVYIKVLKEKPIYKFV